MICCFYSYRLRRTNEQTSENESATPKITLDVLEKKSRKFNIDLTPKVRMNEIINTRPFLLFSSFSFIMELEVLLIFSFNQM